MDVFNRLISIDRGGVLSVSVPADAHTAWLRMKAHTSDVGESIVVGVDDIDFMISALLDAKESLQAHGKR